jgi:hypothetical protein
MILLEDHSDEAQRLLEGHLKNTDPIYGEGLRRVIGMVSQYGVEGWLDYLKTNSNLPDRD